MHGITGPGRSGHAVAAELDGIKMPQHRQVSSFDQGRTAGLVERVEHRGNHRVLGDSRTAAVKLSDPPQQLINDTRHIAIVPAAASHQCAYGFAGSAFRRVGGAGQRTQDALAGG